MFRSSKRCLQESMYSSVLPRIKIVSTTGSYFANPCYTVQSCGQIAYHVSAIDGGSCFSDRSFRPAVVRTVVAALASLIPSRAGSHQASFASFQFSDQLVASSGFTPNTSSFNRCARELVVERLDATRTEWSFSAMDSPVCNCTDCGSI